MERTSTFDNYKVRLMVGVMFVALSFGFYFCWEVLYQERVIVNLLAFTEMERSKEAEQKSYLHEWIMEHGEGGSHGSDAQGAAMPDGLKTSRPTDFAHQELHVPLEQRVHQGAPLSDSGGSNSKTGFPSNHHQGAPHAGLDLAQLEAALQEKAHHLETETVATAVEPTDEILGQGTGGTISEQKGVDTAAQRMDAIVKAYRRQKLERHHAGQTGNL